MKIHKLELKNGYKRFHHLTIDLGDQPSRFVALVGPNGCGKSSVLDGMLYVQNAHAQIGKKGQKPAEYHSMHGNPSFDWQNIQIDFGGKQYREIRSAKNTDGNQATIFSFRSPYRYNAVLNVRETRATNDLRQNSYGSSFTSDLDEKMEENYRRLFAKYNQYRDENDLPPSKAKAHIIGELNQSLQNCLEVTIESLGNIEAGEGSIFFKKAGQSDPFRFDVLSSGEKEVVDIILDLYLRREIYNDTIFLIDEPELHINTAIQRKLLIEIDRMIGENCQIWVATHSIGFLRALQEDIEDCQIIHFDPDVPYASQPHTLTPIKKSAANWKLIFQTALDDLSELVAPRRIIYCEGRDKTKNGEEAGLDALVYNRIFAENYSDTLFVSAGGNTELDQRSDIAISILSKVFKEVEILVLKDRDAGSGKAVSQEERELYLKTNADNHRMLVRWEVENYLYDKEVLRAFCSANGLEFNETEYDGLVQSIVDDNLKDCTSQIKSICSIKTSISKEKFKQQLAEFLTPDLDAYKELESCIFGGG